ncbi:MAG: hypothetical protein HOO96_07825 [Polyangiaceae bacterium]|nr:hypothetical protein [Polyangiaceae bacterium]
MTGAEFRPVSAAEDAVLRERLHRAHFLGDPDQNFDPERLRDPHWTGRDVREDVERWVAGATDSVIAVVFHLESDGCYRLRSARLGAFLDENWWGAADVFVCDEAGEWLVYFSHDDDIVLRGLAVAAGEADG